MSKVNTKDRIVDAALELFLSLGYQKTSIARIETEAGLVPRAGAFYRHFASKEALLVEIAKSHVSETPEQFKLDRLSDFGNTRSELVAIAVKYEEAMHRQKPFARLIEEVRLLDFGVELQDELNNEMMLGLTRWVEQKPAAQGKSKPQVAALVINIFGSWLFFLNLLKQGGAIVQLRDTQLNEWAQLWAETLDKVPSQS